MADRRAPSRRGLLWSALLLAVVLAGADLLRGRDSLLRAWWDGIHVSRGESTRRLLEDFRKNRGFGRSR